MRFLFLFFVLSSCTVHHHHGVLPTTEDFQKEPILLDIIDIEQPVLIPTEQKSNFDLKENTFLAGYGLLQEDSITGNIYIDWKGVTKPSLEVMELMKGCDAEPKKQTKKVKI